MSEFQASNFKKENGGTPNLVGKTELTSPYFFVPPSGDTASRPENCAAGTLRFNTDHGSLEVYRGDTIGWEHIERREGQYLGGSIGPTYAGSTNGTGTRGIYAGGNTPSYIQKIEFITISTMGSPLGFGDLTIASTGRSGTASRTRGLFTGVGNAPSGQSNVIEFITISSTGDATDFGDATVGQGYRGGCSNEIRSVTGGQNTGSNLIDYVTIASLGDAVDFGDLSYNCSTPISFASPTRGIFGGGDSSPQINFITIASTGNASDFGSLRFGTVASDGCCNAIRGVAKLRGGSYVNDIDFITIATQGNAVNFGDATNNAGGTAPMSSSTRAVFAGGYGSPAFRNDIFKVEIATTGNAVDFAGDVSYNADHLAGFSNGHGGL